MKKNTQRTLAGRASGEGADSNVEFPARRRSFDGAAPPWAIKLILVFAALVCALVPFEVGFRLWTRYSHPKTVTRDRPLWYFAPTGSPSAADYVYPITKPANTFRVAAIGDSFTFPTHMQFDDVFPKRLERMLNLNAVDPSAPQALRAQVINFGRMGASSKSEIAILKRALDFNPDLVVLEITLNDPEPRNLHMERKKHPSKYSFGPMEITPETHPILYHWRSLGFLVQRFHNNGTLQAVIDYYRDMYRPDGRWTLFTRSLLKMKKLADRHGVPLVAMVFPLFYTPMDEHYPFLDVHHQITNYLDSIHVTNFDLLPSFAGMNPERLIVLPGEDSHPNEIAHRIVAESLYTFLDKQGLIPAGLRVTDRYASRGVRPVRLNSEAPQTPPHATSAQTPVVDGTSAVSDDSDPELDDSEAEE
ncbi:MAG: hypothetical protein U0136_18720 [Bdellovibrionota bacterium]